jgi:hypothetical protein
MRPFAGSVGVPCPFEHLSLHIFATNEREMQEIWPVPGFVDDKLS